MTGEDYYGAKGHCKMTDHDLLIRIDERTEVLVEAFKEHMAHHFAFKLAAFSALVGSIFAIAIACFKR